MSMSSYALRVLFQGTAGLYRGDGLAPCSLAKCSCFAFVGSVVALRFGVGGALGRLTPVLWRTILTGDVMADVVGLTASAVGAEVGGSSCDVIDAGSGGPTVRRRALSMSDAMARTQSSAEIELSSAASTRRVSHMVCGTRNRVVPSVATTLRRVGNPVMVNFRRAACPEVAPLRFPPLQQRTRAAGDALAGCAPCGRSRAGSSGVRRRWCESLRRRRRAG